MTSTVSPLRTSPASHAAVSSTDPGAPTGIPGRRAATASASGLAEAVAARNPQIPVAAPGSVEATAVWLAREVRAGDAVLVMGGGRSYRIGELLLERLGSRRTG